MIDIKQHSLYKPMETDSVISNIFSVYFKRFWILFFSSFIAAFIIQMTFYQFGFHELAKLTNPEELINTIFNMRKEILIGSIVYFVIYGFLIGFVINFIIKIELDNDFKLKYVFTDAVKNHSVHVIFFFILSMLIIVVGSTIGLLVFIIGVFVAMLYLATVLAPGSAIIVAESKNAIEAIGRAFILTHKNFWSVLGAILLFVLILLLVSIIMSAIMAIPYIIIFFDNWREAENFRDIFNIQIYDIGIWSVVLNSIVSAITYPLYAILSVVLYFKLRFLEDKVS